MSTVAWEYLSGVGLVRARIPLSAFRVPSGKIAITMSLHEVRCVTAVLDAADIDSWLAKFETGMGMGSVDRADVGAHVQIRELLRQDLAQGGDAEMDACVAAALWLTPQPPFCGRDPEERCCCVITQPGPCAADHNQRRSRHVGFRRL
jgi:hypothetical protein